MSIFENELTWMFIAGSILGCVAVHSCSRTDQESFKTQQVEIRAKADIEIAKIRAGLVTNTPVMYQGTHEFVTTNAEAPH